MTLDYDIYKEGGILNDRYQKVEDISEGSYGYVSLAKDVKEKKLVAVKYIFKIDNEDNDSNGEDENINDLDDIDNEDVESTTSSTERTHQMVNHKKSLISSKVRSKLSNNICLEAMYEVDIQMKVGIHRNVASLLDFFDSYIVMEYCSGGDLYEAIKDDIVPRKTSGITNIFNQIIDAIEFVHSKSIFHRDIKPENILISGIDWTIKLTDWGLATTSITSTDRSVGSERYMAPELFESNLAIKERKAPYECAKVDLWAMGIVFLNIVFQKNPFSVANESDKSFCYFAANREALFDVFSTMSYDFFQVLRYSLTIDPTNRDLNKMRYELEHLSEFTLDDEYYNGLGTDNFTPVSDASEYLPTSVEMPPIPPSSAPIPFSMPTPVPSMLIATEVEAKPNLVPGDITIPQLIETSNDNAIKGRAKSVPKFKFNKRSHIKTETSNTSNPRRSFNEGKNKNPRAIRIQNKKKAKIIKHSRKPLGLPTPNTHMNSFFYDYNSKDNFNTHDFFTPPSVHNRYMEGIFNNKQHKQQHQNRNNNYNGNKNWYKSYNNNNGYNNSYSKSRRPSTTGSTIYGDSLTIPKFKDQHSRSNNASKLGSSPGRYIPPNLRPPSSAHVDFSHIPSISAVLNDQPVTTFHEQYSHDSAVMDNADHDLDDVLFTLEENDYDFVQDMKNMSIQEQNDPYMNHGQSQMPDLLMPKPTKESHIQSYNSSSSSRRYSNNSGSHNDISQGDSRRQSSAYKHRPGVYVPPHHRRSSASANEAILSVSNNTVNFSEAYNQKRQNMTPSPRNVGNPLKMHEVNSSFRPLQHAFSTTAVQDNDIFATSNNDALLFEDDEDDYAAPHRKAMFGPYEIYDQTSQSIGNARKSSILKEQAVGSLEEYKNNWLMLQQQQD